MKPTRIIPLCLLALGLMAAAAHVARAVPDAATYDASMSHAVAVAPVQVITATAPAAPAEVPIQELVALGLTLFAFCLRRFSPGVAWLHTGTGLALVSTLTMILTAVAGAIAHQGVSVRVVLVALTSAMTAALAQANTSPQGTGALFTEPPSSSGPSPSSARAFLPVLFFLAAAPLLSSCSAAQWQTYLAKGGTCELQAAAAALGSGATGLLQDIEAAAGGQPAFSPDAWAARAVAGLGAAAIAEAQCRAAHLLADLSQRQARTDGVRVASTRMMRWRPICHSVQEAHRPYLEALLRVRGRK